MMAPTNLSPTGSMHGRAPNPVRSPVAGPDIHPAVQDLRHQSGGFVGMVHDGDSDFAAQLATVAFDKVDAILAQWPGNVVLRFMSKHFPSYLQFLASADPPISFDQGQVTLGDFVIMWENAYLPPDQIDTAPNSAMADSHQRLSPFHSQNSSGNLSSSGSNITTDGFPPEFTPISPTVDTQTKRNTIHKRESRARKHKQDLDSVRAACDKRVRQAEEKLERQVHVLKAENTAEVEKVKKEHEKALEELRNKCDAAQSNALTRMSESNQDLAKHNVELAMYNNDMIHSREEIRRLQEEITQLRVRNSELSLTNVRLEEEWDAAAVRHASPSMLGDDGFPDQFWNGM